MKSAVLRTRPLGFPWETTDPFLFCAYHDDAYPAGDARMAPAASLDGRELGRDFAGKDGWRMYHGTVVPGFPQHPHRGFETVTIVRRGYIDHSDSLGAAARFGAGDVQWITAGAGIVHAEMFPLLERGKPNPLELFQIWLNLPSRDKLVAPHFSMLWNADVPRCVFKGAAGRRTEVVVVAGRLEGKAAPPPPPHSWAARSDTDVAIWCIRLEAGASWQLPRAESPQARRTLYFYRGPSMRVADHILSPKTAAEVRSDDEVLLAAGDEECEVLLLQGRPIGEKVAQYGPFVMNEAAEIQQAMADYRRTQFGGWPWPVDDPVHRREEGRFAKHADGRLEYAAVDVASPDPEP